MPEFGSYLLDPSPGPADTLVYVLGAVFAVALAASLYFYVRRGSLLGEGTPLAALAGRAGLAGALVAGFGLLFAVAAVFQVPVLSARIWLVALFLVGLLVVAYLVYYLRARLPGQMAEYQQEMVRQRHLSRPAGKKGGKKRERKRKKK